MSASLIVPGTGRQIVIRENSATRSISVDNPANIDDLEVISILIQATLGVLARVISTVNQVKASAEAVKIDAAKNKDRQNRG